MESISRTERKKDARREEILMAAEVLFLEKGYRRTSVNDLAEKADLTKKTLYSYFAGKEDLYYAVVARWYEALLAEVVKALTEPGRVIDRIMSGTRAYVDLYRRNPVCFLLMNDLESVRMACDVDTLPGKIKLNEIKKELFARMVTLFDEGKKDGSVRDDLETATLVSSFIFTLTGFFCILSSNGTGFAQAFRPDLAGFIDTSVALMVDSLKGGKLQ